MARNALGSTVALLGAAAAVASPFQAWYGNRQGRDIRMEDLFDGITTVSAELWESVFVVMLFVALLTLVGVIFRSRLTVALAGIVSLGFTVLWMVRQGQATGSLTAGGAEGLGAGAALAAGGSVLILLGALLMAGRKRRRSRHGRGGELAEPEPYGYEPEPEPYYGPGGPGGPVDGDTPTQPYPPPPPPPDEPWPPDHRPPPGR
ncbi:hypothetical protein ACFYYR_17275 [Streptomyces sp. NPDC001922]|uniref:hypothetical protein n=1 Tax=Streptomyces sp. NPDC001922 TaxID=3364624 RepID=UPI0036AD1A19